MKVSVIIARVLVGVLFIFSGLVKAIDPLGLSYKMNEFFEVWALDGYFPKLMHWLNLHSFSFSLIMITLEVALGVALLVGWRKKLTLRLLLLLMLFFTFLTSYVLFTGKIRSCGCFGDCIPLTPVQTFTKDIILLLLIILLLRKQKYIEPIFKELLPLALVLVSIVGTAFLQMYVVDHLPLVDCLPFKKGNDILALRKTPADATFDQFAYTYFYHKGSEEKDFEFDKQPDSTWLLSEGKDPKKKLIKKGNGKLARINDFALSSADGADSTETILNKPAYYLFFIKDLEEGEEKWLNNFGDLYKKAAKENKPIYIVTANREKVNQFFNQFHDFKVAVYTCDDTAIKTAARANPTLFEMTGPVVKQKYSWADFDKALK